jgi:hypothetical protein
MLADNLVNDGWVSSCAVASFAVPQKMNETNRTTAVDVGNRRIDVPA